MLGPAPSRMPVKLALYAIGFILLTSGFASYMESQIETGFYALLPGYLFILAGFLA